MTAESIGGRLLAAVARGAADLFPGYFALVMATGIVSVASHLLQLPFVARALFGINVVAYIVLWLLTLVRLAGYRDRLLRDLADHASGPGFLTIVAGTCILGAQLVVIADAPAVAWALWLLGTGLWILLIYSLITIMTVRSLKPGLEAGINGGWLLMIVATQAVSVLGTFLAPFTGDRRELLLLFTLGLFLVGCMLYILVISLIFYRLLFFSLDPNDLTPPYWINMGAVAITTLAGAALMLAVDQWIFLDEILPFLKGFTVFFWATGTWWIPLLLVLGLWRHGIRRVPLRYGPQYWSMVFPLGMYTACTFRLVQATGWEFMLPLPRAMLWVALAAWVATFIGLVHSLARDFIDIVSPHRRV